MTDCEIAVNRFRNCTALVLFFLLISRLLAMWLMPLNDTTEARYGEIARIMLQTGDWITPMQGIGVPFWAKPPLSTWFSAFSMKIFGVNEFAARFPSLLLSLGILWLVWDIAKKRHGVSVGSIAVLVLAGSLFFFLDAGVVMTDPALIATTTTALIAFWHAVVRQNKFGGYGFFLSLGFGLLAKGPIALILVGMPVFIWSLVYFRRYRFWYDLPWISGSLLMLLISVPWYILAEIKTPGFLNYFIIGEHIHRFLDPGWAGDKYGFAHQAHYGMIWIYAFVGLIPWSIVSGIWLLTYRNKITSIPRLAKDTDGWFLYLMLCSVMPLVFFTFSGNIIYPYMFPSLPFWALLFAEITHRAGITERLRYHVLYLASIAGIVFLIVTMLFVVTPERVAKSQNRVVAAYQNAAHSSKSMLIYWSNKTDFSAQFYSKGQVVATQDIHELCRLLSNTVDNYLVIQSNEIMVIPDMLRRHLVEIAKMQVLNHQLIVLQSDGVECHL